MRKTGTFALTAVAALALVIGIASGQHAGEIALDDEFIGNITAKSPLLRDNRLESKIGRPVRGECVVTGVDEYKRYDCTHRITGRIEKADFTLIIYLFSTGRQVKRISSKGMAITFKGQIMAATPLDLKKDAYILDIKLSEAAPKSD